MNIPSVCTHCYRVVPANQRCSCRPPRKRPPATKSRRGEATWREEYDKAGYRNERQHVLTKQSGRCFGCGAQIARRKGSRWVMDKGAGATHHIRSLSKGGDHQGNLVALCTRCHAEMHKRERRR